MAEYMYGIRNVDKKIISIDEVPNDKPGLKCDCVCPECGRALEACSLHGKVNRYFRHYTDKNGSGGGGNGCDALTANETALHRMAKEIVAEELKIFVPVKKISFKEAGLAELPQKIKDKIPRYEVQPARLVEGRAAEVEKNLGGLKPDVILKTERGELLIEVFVQHKVGEEKKAKAKEFGSAMLEMDLSGFLEKPISREELRKIILSNADLKQWIYYPVSNTAKAKARQFYEETDVIKRYLKEHGAELERKRREEAKKEQRESKITQLFEPQNYAAELNRLRNDEEFLRACAKNYKKHYFDFGSYFRKYKKVPFFIDIPIAGEMIFQCDRRIWQSILFNRFIYGRSNDFAPFKTKEFFGLLKNEYRIPVDCDLAYKLPDPRNEFDEIWLPHDVIETYMDYLETLGFIKTDHKKYYWKTVMARKTIIPQIKTAAETMEKGLQAVDLRSPVIDELIDEQMAEYYLEQRRRAVEARQKAEAERKAREEEEVRKRREKLQAAREAADKRARELKEKRRQEILSFDYNQAETRIYDLEEYPMAQCSCCGQVMRARKMRSFDLTNMNKGICNVCYAKHRTKSFN